MLVCVNDGLLKLRINRILSEKNYAFTLTGKPIKRDDLVRYDLIIIHSSYKLANLYNFIENAVIQKLATIFYITTNINSNPFRKFKQHTNLVYIDENKMDVELALSISLYEKYNNQIEKLSAENIKLTKALQEKNLMKKCKRFLIKKGLTEEEAHKYILKYAMNNHIDKIEGCKRLLEINSE
ncbi:hypothetical protein RJI07_05315 [Mycoplasmatota bacterium WC30]